MTNRLALATALAALTAAFAPPAHAHSFKHCLADDDDIEALSASGTSCDVANRVESRYYADQKLKPFHCKVKSGETDRFTCRAPHHKVVKWTAIGGG